MNKNYRITFHIGLQSSMAGFESKDLKGELNAILNTYIDGYTILYGQGYWQGQSEECAMVIVYIDSNKAEDGWMPEYEDNKSVCEFIGKRICKKLGQYEVLITIEELKMISIKF